MQNRMIRAIVERYRAARLHRRLLVWGGARRIELDLAHDAWSDRDAERIAAAMRTVECTELPKASSAAATRPPGMSEAPEAERLSDSEVARKFTDLTAPMRQVKEVIAHVDAGLDVAIRAHQAAGSDRMLLEHEYGRTLVEKTAAVREVEAFDGISGFLRRRFPRLVEFGARRAVPYPPIVAAIFLAGCATAGLAATGRLGWALVALVATTIVDCLDGILVRASRRNVGAGKYITCLVSNFTDLIMFEGLALYALRTGRPALALLVSAAAAIAIFGSFTRTAALRVGVRIDRTTVERLFRFGGLFLAFGFDAPVIAAALVAAYGGYQLVAIIRRVVDAQVWGMAVAVGGAEGRSESRAWAWTTPEDEPMRNDEENALTAS